MSVDPCAPHRPYVAAMVDGERGMVPWRTRWHVRRCAGCQSELRAHLALDRRMAQLVAHHPDRPGDTHPPH